MKLPTAHPIPMPTAAVLDVRNAAALLGMSEKALRHLVERRRIPFRRLGRKIIFLKTELDAWLGSLSGISLQEVKSIHEHELDRNVHTG